MLFLIFCSYWSISFTKKDMHFDTHIKIIYIANHVGKFGR